MPRLVQTCWVRLRTYPSVPRGPRVFTASASDPESGSGRPRPPMTNLSGFVNCGSQRIFCSSVPLERMPAIARPIDWMQTAMPARSEEHTSELQSHLNLVCRLLLEKKNNTRREQVTSHTI